MIRNYRKLFEDNFNLNLDDENLLEYEEDLPDKIEMAGYTWKRIGFLHGDSIYLRDDMVSRMIFSEHGNTDWNTKPMKWYSGDIQPKTDRDYPNCLVKTKDGRYLLTYWQSFMKKFIIDDESLVKLDTDQIEKWFIISETE